MSHPIIKTLSFAGYLTSSGYISFQLLAGGVLPEASIPMGFGLSIIAWPLVVGGLVLRKISN